MKSNRELLFVAAFTVLAFMPGCSTAQDTQINVTTPDDIVHIILDDAKPEKPSYCWKTMTNKRLQYLTPYLSPQIVYSLQEWIISRDKLASLGSPEGAYDPLTYHKWQPEKESIGKATYSGDTANVLVRETHEPGKIYSGYHGTSRYKFSRQNGKWKLDNIDFSRKYIASKGGEHVSLLQLLGETTLRMQRLYKSQLKIQSMQGKK